MRLQRSGTVFGTFKPGSSIGEDEATSGGKYRMVWPKYVTVYINIDMCRFDVMCDVRGAVLTELGNLLPR